MFFIDSIKNSQTNKFDKKEVLFLKAGRGRGKSAALGISIAGSLMFNLNNIYLSAATNENLKTVFEFIIITLEALGFKKNLDFKIKCD